MCLLALLGEAATNIGNRLRCTSFVLTEQFVIPHSIVFSA